VEYSINSLPICCSTKWCFFCLSFKERLQKMLLGNLVFCIRYFSKMKSNPAKKTSEQCFIGKTKPTRHLNTFKNGQKPMGRSYPQPFNWPRSQCVATEHRTSIVEVSGLNPIEALIFSVSRFSFQLLKLENLLWCSFFTFQIFIAVGVLPVRLLAYQVSMVCAANWPR